MCVGRLEIEAIDLAELSDALQRRLAERCLSLECVENNSLEKFSERDFELFGQTLHDLEDALFDADAGLNPLDGLHKEPR